MAILAKRNKTETGAVLGFVDVLFAFPLERFLRRIKALRAPHNGLCQRSNNAESAQKASSRMCYQKAGLAVFGLTRRCKALA
ncbi:hypothetical protein [Chitinilyticum litopenaei]|uniref:hypothetical protein n=1 Tax=Chitinilyticum litopenaei TaxID=1121276 RepID=UPI0011863823|nr:hypothetical protein [Chitinilyticum litopenaei]